MADSQATPAWQGAGDRPDWVTVLNEKCAASSQAKVATELGLASSTLGQIRKGIYPASTERIEAKVRGVLMAVEVTCPALGFEIPAQRCAEYQTAGVTPANPLWAKLSGTCPTCPHNFRAESGGDA
ncbi:MAG: hypothetical protein AAF609_22850 [Cyanobacteria bacterium P01_C01_bin.120]